MIRGMCFSVRAGTRGRKVFSPRRAIWMRSGARPAYSRVMDLTGVTTIYSRSGVSWEALPGSVRTASLQTLTGKHDFLEFIVDGDRMYIAVAEVALMRAPDSRTHY